GPLCATLLIGVLGTRGVLRWTLLPGLAAAVSFAAFAPSAKRARDSAPAISSFGSRIVRLPRGYWHFLVGVLAHGIGDFAPTLLILRAGQILTPRYGGAKAATIAVGLYTFYNVVNAAAAYPAGALADRIGKRGLLAAGYAVGAATYIGFIFEQPTIPVLAILFGFAGVHGAVQQSLEKSVAAELLPKDVRGSGFGVLATANGVGDFVSSIAVGALWSSVSAGAGFLYAGIFSAIGAVIVYSSRAR
ncbi:MAG: MFS transporter, partial [Candidatus Acidiferrales bacterium]